jgi:hypothetical protein
MAVVGYLFKIKILRSMSSTADNAAYAVPYSQTGLRAFLGDVT